MLAQVLLVDDEPDHLRLLSDCLASVNCRFEMAVNGRQALAICRRQRFDLGIVDIHLPDLSGMELVPQFRAWNPHMGVFLITAFAQVPEAVRAVRDLKVHDYIEKPYSPAVVRDKVSSFLAQRGHSRQLRVGNLVIRPESWHVETNGRVVKLSCQEFNLLLILARAEGQVVSHEELIRGVWRCEPTSSELAAIRTAMSRLRNALNDDPQAPRYIQTVRGRGYRVVV